MIKLNEAQLRRSIDNLVQEKLKEYKEYVDGVISTWDSDVGTAISGNKLVATGSDWKVWFYVDKGTEGHPITAKSGGYLAIPFGTFTPRTKPTATVTGGSGGYSPIDGYTFPQSVWHPGAKARNFIITKMENDKGDLAISVSDAIDEAIRYGNI